MNSNEMLDNWKSKHSVHYSNIKKEKKVKIEDKMQDALRTTAKVIKDGKSLLVDSYYFPVGTEIITDEKKAYRKKDLGIWDEIPYVETMGTVDENPL